MPQVDVPMLPALPIMEELPLGVLDEESSNDSNNESFSTGSRPLSPILRYEDPILVRPHAGFDLGTGHDSLPQYASLYKAVDEQRKKEAVGGARRTIKRPARNENTAVLKAIIPNRKWANDAGEWVQTVSMRERNRVDLDSLRSKVDARLATLQARPGAICVVREQVFSELFDELIRGITLECPERGLLLLRLRDEARMKLETYNEIYRDTVVLSSRKAEDARAELDGCQRLLAELEAKASHLKERAKSLDVELDLINRSNASAQANTELEHAEQLNLLAAEQNVLEAAIAKFRKSLKEATTPAET